MGCCALGVARAVRAGESAKGPAPAGDEALELFKDQEAGYSFRVPAGYARLTPDENREVLNSLSQRAGKDVGDRALRRPSVYFKGPADPQRPKVPPPMLVVSCPGAVLVVDPARKAEYKARFEEDYRKSGIKHGDISIEIVKVDGIDSVRAEHDVFDSLTNTRNQLVRVLVPASDRCYDILINFSPEQAGGAEPALATVLKTFKAAERPMLDVESQGKWLRIALWTIGGFVAGIAISLLWRTISGAGGSAQTKPAR